MVNSILQPTVAIMRAAVVYVREREIEREKDGRGKKDVFINCTSK